MKITLGGVLGVLGAIGFGAALFVAYGKTHTRLRAGQAVDQVQALLPIVANCVAKYAAEHGGTLPVTAPRVPSRLEELGPDGKALTLADVSNGVYSCQALVEGPLLVQFQWIRTDDRTGGAFAWLDSDKDGKADAWFEVPVACAAGRGCVAPNYVFDVEADGVRHPPLFLDLTGKADKYQGKPPDMMDEDVDAAPAALAAKAAPARKLVKEATVGLDGSPAVPVVIQRALDQKARLELAGADLIGFDVTGVSGGLLDPKSGGQFRLTYGVPSEGGVVKKGAPILLASYTQSGLTLEKGEAKEDRPTLFMPDCSVERAFELTKATSLGLLHDPKAHRQLWFVATEGQKDQLLSAEDCAKVGR